MRNFLSREARLPLLKLIAIVFIQCTMCIGVLKIPDFLVMQFIILLYKQIFLKYENQINLFKIL